MSDVKTQILDQPYQTKVDNTILVVEDDCILQQIHRIYLQRLGYEVDVAKAGYQALALHSKKNYQAILLDMGLPDISGKQVLETIRAREEGNRSTPIIIATANGNSEDKNICLNKGASAFYEKPLSKSILHDALNRLLNQQAF